LDRHPADPARTYRAAVVATSMAAVMVVALVAGFAVIAFVLALGTNDPEPKPGRDVSAPPPRHDADPATNSAQAPQRWPAGRERAVREYAADFLRWERGMKPASWIRHATPELRRLLGDPPRITPASRPPKLAHSKHGLMGIDVYLEADTAQVRVRVGAGGMADHMGDEGPGVHRWESFGVQLGRFDGRWMVTAHIS
jgi:hypothetical protein